MSLREDMWKYEQITGESAEHVPIIKLGAFLDGYEIGLKALEQQSCGDCISRAEALRIAESYYHTEQVVEEIRELSSVTPKTDILDKIRAEIKQKVEQEEFARSVFRHEEKDAVKAEQCTGSIMAYNNMIKLINKYKTESEDKE